MTMAYSTWVEKFDLGAGSLGFFRACKKEYFACCCSSIMMTLWRDCLDTLLSPQEFAPI
jgi:hypothetical protein